MDQHRIIHHVYNLSSNTVYTHNVYINHLDFPIEFKIKLLNFLSCPTDFPDIHCICFLLFVVLIVWTFAPFIIIC